MGFSADAGSERMELGDTRGGITEDPSEVEVTPLGREGVEKSFLSGATQSLRTLFTLRS